MDIYTSDWNPRGVRKDWERTSLANESAQRALGVWAREGKVIDACAWFDTNDVLRVMVADTDDGQRFVYRNTAKGVSIAIQPAHSLSSAA